MNLENILGTEKISKLFIKFSVPAIIAMLINGMQTIIDGIFLGNFVGPNAMASVNLVQPFTQLIIGSSMIISIGCLSFIGRTIGEGKVEYARNIFKTSTILMISISLIITILGLTSSKSIAFILGANDVLLDSVSIYIKTLSIFAIPMSIMFLFGFVDRVIEKPHLYLNGSILSVLTNIVLNYILIKKLQLGIKGAAIATGMSYSIALFIVIVPMLNKNTIVNIFKGKFDKTTIWPVIYNGSSEGVIAIAIATTAYIFNIAFMKIAGEFGIAAFTSISYISQFGTLIMFGISDGIGPIISYNYGYKDFDRVKEVLNISYKVTLVVGVILFCTLFLFGENLVSMFVSGNKQVSEMAIEGAKLYAFAFFLNGFNIVYSGYFTAIGKAKESIIISACRGIVFVIVGIAILPNIMSLSGIWLTIPFAELMTFIVGTSLINKNKFSENIESIA